MITSLSPLWAVPAGLAIGSFCNVVIHRLPLMLDAEHEAPHQKPALSLSLPRSHCPHCQTPLRTRDLVPVLSWLLLRGRCHHCQAAISARYPLIELIVTALAFWCALRLDFTHGALAAFSFLTLLLCVTVIDWRTQWLPDRLTLSLLWLGLLASSLTMNPAGTSLQDAVWGAAAGYLSLRLVNDTFHLITKRHGMGGGDMKLLAALGAWLGWQLLPLLIILSSSIGLLIALWFRWREGRDGEFPFGPALALAGACLFWQHGGLL